MTERKKQIPSFDKLRTGASLGMTNGGGIDYFRINEGSEDVGLRYAHPTYPDYPDSPPSVIPDPDRGSSVFAFVAAPSLLKGRDMPYGASSKHPQWPHKACPGP